MNAWAKVGTTEAAENAEELLDSMLRASGDKAIKPDVTVFNSVINAWATSKDPIAGKKAFSLLRRMKDLAGKGYTTYPDIVTYNTVLSAWSHCGDVNAAPQTEKIVNEMQKASRESALAPRPNTVSYNTILDAWSKSTLPGSALRAQKVLEFMIRSEEKEIEPDVISFTSVLDAWAKSKEPHKGARTRDLLNQLVSLHQTTKRPNLRPTQISYNSVLNACAFSAIGTSLEEQREALQIAVKTFSEMRRSRTTAPDTVSYGNMLKCLANLMPQGDLRTKMALQIFAKCSEEGSCRYPGMERSSPSRSELGTRKPIESAGTGWQHAIERPTKSLEETKQRRQIGTADNPSEERYTAHTTAKTCGEVHSGDFGPIRQGSVASYNS